MVDLRQYNWTYGIDDAEGFDILLLHCTDGFGFLPSLIMTFFAQSVRGLQSKSTDEDDARSIRMASAFVMLILFIVAGYNPYSERLF